jgi:integrase
MEACLPQGQARFGVPDRPRHHRITCQSYKHVLIPTLVAARVTVLEKDEAGGIVVDEQGEPVHAAKYTGLHALRHFFASWCINRKADGGLELPAKVVQERLGHSTIVMTLDRYGHLFPRGDDTPELAAAESSLWS